MPRHIQIAETSAHKNGVGTHGYSIYVDGGLYFEGHFAGAGMSSASSCRMSENICISKLNELAIQPEDKVFSHEFYGRTHILREYLQAEGFIKQS